MSGPCKVVVADPLSIFRAGVRNLLEQERDFEALEASDLDELLEFFRNGQPEIVLLASDLPPGGAVDAVSSLRRTSSAHIVIWDFAPAPETVVAALRAGADGYIR